MAEAGLVFPHQLFKDTPVAASGRMLLVVEENLFFRQFPFHKMKIAFHRAGMRCYAAGLAKQGFTIEYVHATSSRSDIRNLTDHLRQQGITKLHYIDPTDDWLGRRLRASCRKHGLEAVCHPSPQFLNTPEANSAFFSGKKRFFQTDYYIHQRKLRGILLDGQQKPLGGKWSFDDENRLRYPAGKIPPHLQFPGSHPWYEEAIAYTNQHFSENPGQIVPERLYPVTPEDSRQWLQAFLESRFEDFGRYEDALVAGEHWLHHSLLSPLLNVGLLTPVQVVDEALRHGAAKGIPMNSLEGFIRQLIGWREFIRAVYELQGRAERTRNFWGFSRRIPASFWTGHTGILPVDTTIRKVLETGYCHHIERLMVLGNFMLLCEFDPDDVYRWFMELFIDAYDWVMVPNVYGMSQFADGGLMSTKPYISGSNYLMKMGDYAGGEWQPVWDGLFWRFMDRHREFFLKNPRLGMLVKTFDRMPESKKITHLERAEHFLASL